MTVEHCELWNSTAQACVKFARDPPETTTCNLNVKQRRFLDSFAALSVSPILKASLLQGCDTYLINTLVIQRIKGNFYPCLTSEPLIFMFIKQDLLFRSMLLLLFAGILCLKRGMFYD